MNEIGVSYQKKDRHGNTWEFIDLDIPRVCRIGMEPDEADEIDRKTQEKYDKKFKK